MAVRPLVYYPDERLTKSCQQVGAFDAELAEFGKDLADSMFAWGGVGIAAPQVGDSRMVFAITTELADQGLSKWIGPESREGNAWLFVNPAIIRMYPGARETGLEGCLSFPDIFVRVPRCKDIVLEAYNIEGKKFTVVASGFLGRALQHELDHLLGVTMIDELSYLRRQRILKKLSKWKKKHGGLSH